MEDGFLCTLCLEKRLGRSLQEDDYQFRSVGVNENGLQMVASPEYVAKVGVNRRTRRARRKQAGGTSCYP
jgi:hypothetical protein